MADVTGEQSTLEQLGDMRVEVAAAAIAALCSILWIARWAYDAWTNALARAQLPFADNQWSEGPLMLQIHRMATGSHAFMPTSDANSYDYGPAYVWFLQFAQHALGLPPSVVTMRGITIAFGLLTIVPLAIASVLIARRIGIPAKSRLSLRIAAFAGVAIGTSILFRCITFDVVHPDDVFDFLMLSSLALYYAIAQGFLDRRWIWGLVILTFLPATAKQSAYILFPLLAIGLVAAKRITTNLAVRATIAFGGGAAAFFLLIPSNARAWTFVVPAAHPYQFTDPKRLLDCFQHLTIKEPYLGISILGCALVVWAIGRSAGRSAFLVDLAPLAATGIMAFGAFFKILGIYNNLSILGVVAAPYLAAGVAALIERSPTLRLPTWSKYAATALTILLAFSLGETQRQVPDKDVVGMLRGVHETAQKLCAQGSTIVVLTQPDMFFGCPNARYALAASVEELDAAFPRYSSGGTLFDKPLSAKYVFSVRELGLPPPWRSGYELLKTQPTYTGYGDRYFPTQIDIYRHA